MTKITYSAPAKVILSGEHSVVYFEPAIVMAFDLRLRFCLSQSDSAPKKIDKNISKANEIVLNYLKSNNISYKEKNFTYELESQIPIGQGFGSSAAFSVATTAAFWEFYTQSKPNLDQENKTQNPDFATLNELAYQMEKIFHGNPSGMDNSASCYGGLIYYRKEFEFLKNISTLPFDLPQDWQDKIYLIHTGNRTETTKEIVARVEALIEKNGALYKKILRDIGKTTKTMVIAINQNREKLFVDTITKNQKLLDKLGVVDQKTKKILNSLESFGIGKVMGSGGIKNGSGYILFYCQQKANSLEKYLQDHKHIYLKFKLSSDGVRRE